MHDCEICGIGPGCLCTVHECSTYYYPASKEQVIDRLYKGLYKNHRDNMKKYLKDTFGVTFIDHSELPGERRITMNDDAISRQEAIDAVDSETVSTNPEHFKSSEKFIEFMDDTDIASFGKWQWANGFNTALVATTVQLKNLPSAERRGRWIFNIDDKGWSWDKPYMCDQCGEWVEKVFKFCPNCGAKMDGEEE